MKKIVTILAASALGLSLAAITGCSDEAKDAWKEAGSAAVDATKETAEDVKEGSKGLWEKTKEETKELAAKAKEVMEKSEPTDPDTGEVKSATTD